MTYRRMSSGSIVDLANLKPDDFNLWDIEVPLNNILRFNACYNRHRPLTVAQHSMLCVDLARMDGVTGDLMKAIFIHDFGEAFYGDISTPVKKLLGDGYRKFIEPIDRAIKVKFMGREVTDEEHSTVKYYDLLSLDIERRMLWADDNHEFWPEVATTLDYLDKKELFFDAAYRGHISFESVLNDLA